MAKRSRYLYVLSQLFPAIFIDTFERLMIQAGFSNIDPRKYAGFMLLFTIISALVIGFVLLQFFPFSPIIAIGGAIAFLLVAGGTFYFALYFTAETRARKAEEILPEVLKIIAANIRAGLTVENAIWSVSKPEYGVLGEEIKKVSVSTYAGKPINEALVDMTKRLDSKLLERSVKLLVDGIRLGGEVANLLDEVAATVKSAKALRKEINNATLTYVIFIIFASIIVAPMLFALSLYYSETSNKIASQQAGKLNDPQLKNSKVISSGSPLASLAFQKKSADTITAEDIKVFSMSAIGITAFFSAMLIGLIQHGKAKRGIKLVPIFLPLALGIFLFVHEALLQAFKGIVR
ncbi:type II secretion system F family protein [Candidatus Micrarchaeota archaeon]|nr:type II secretion system F family protein [Candidatus Micrarchaeota archaeon]